MNQTPPNEHPQDEPAFARAQATNPYQAGRQIPEDPDLDANAPYLKSADVQRLNRKALMFLGGIVLLLVALAVWVFSGGLSKGDDAPKRQTRGEQVVIPAAPRDLPELPPERPIPLAQSELPPLPVEDTQRNTGAGMGMSMPDLASREASLMERRMQDASASVVGGDPNAQGGLGGMLGGPNQAPASAAQTLPDGATSARPLYKPDTLLLRGTYIRCILQARVISDFPGYTSCVVTEPVYSVNGQRLLLPRGSKVSGSYQADAIVGDRVGIIWDRIVTPTGLDVNMRSPGVDMLGSAGNAGHYDAHWGQRMGSALLISMISDAFKYAGAKHGPQETSFGNGFVVQSPYESNTARTMERLANMALERNMTRPPTVTINQGTIVNVYVARDVDFSAVLR